MNKRKTCGWSELKGWADLSTWVTQRIPEGEYPIWATTGGFTIWEWTDEQPLQVATLQHLKLYTQDIRHFWKL